MKVSLSHRILTDRKILSLGSHCVDAHDKVIAKNNQGPTVQESHHPTIPTTMGCCCCLILSLGSLLKAYRCAIFLHGMRHLMVLVSASFSRKKAVLTHIKVETLEASVSKSANWGSLTYVAFCLMSCRFGR